MQQSVTDIDRFIQHCRVERGLAANTLVAYRKDLSSIQWTVPPGRWTARMVSEHLGALSQSGLAESTVNRHLASLRVFLRFMGNEAAAHVPGAKAPKNLPRPLSSQQIDKILEHASDDERLVIELLYGSGLRASELAVVELAGDRMIRVVGKGDKERIVPTTPWCYSKLEDPKHLAWVHAFDRYRVWHLVNNLGARAGIKASPHMLRHSFATHMLKGGADVRTIQELLGHASVDTTQGYTALDERQMRETIEKYHPREKGKDE